MQCDVVPTKDCILICRHEPEMNLTTDASKYYSNIATTYEIDGANVTVSNRLLTPKAANVLAWCCAGGQCRLVHQKLTQIRKLLSFLFIGDLQH